MTLGSRRNVDTSQNSPSVDMWSLDRVYATTWKFVCTTSARCDRDGTGATSASSSDRAAAALLPGASALSDDPAVRSHDATRLTAVATRHGKSSPNRPKSFMTVRADLLLLPRTETW